MSVSGSPIVPKTILVASDFPTPGQAVTTRSQFQVLATVTDNDPTRTNTGLSFLADDYIIWTGTTWNNISGVNTAGTVTSVSVVSANGLAGSVATPTTTPAFTLSTSITGILKGNGTAISAASSSTDYVAPGANSNITSLTAVNTINIQPIPSTDLTVSGLIIALTAGESLVFGDPVFIKSDGKMGKGDANSAGKFPIQFMAAATIANDASGTFLMQGIARNDAWNWTVGGAIYLSTAAGLTQTPPATTNDCIQVLGFATHADRMFFNPSPDYTLAT